MYVCACVCEYISYIPRHIPSDYINCAIYITRTSPLSAILCPEKHLMVLRQVLMRYTGYFHVSWLVRFCSTTLRKSQCYKCKSYM